MFLKKKNMVTHTMKKWSIVTHTMAADILIEMIYILLGDTLV